MINEGVATKADGLSVRVKVNEAEMHPDQSRRRIEPVKDVALSTMWH